jgi:HK97 family phage portal protein
MGLLDSVLNVVTFGAHSAAKAAPFAAAKSWDALDLKAASPSYEPAPLLGRSTRYSWTDDDAGSFVRESFRIAGIVFRAGTLIADAFAEAPLRTYEERDGQPEEAPNHATRQLFAEPNPEQGEAEFWNTLVLVAFLNGYGLIECVRARDASIVQLYPRTPDSLKRREKSPGVWVWEQRTGRGEIVRQLPDEDVFHVPYQFDPSFQRRGITPVSVLGREIGISVTLTAYLKSFIDEGGIPPFVVKSKDPFADETQPDTMRVRWGQKFGHGEAWSTVPFIGALDIEKVGLNFDEMAFPELTGINELRIAQALGVPPHLLGAKEAIQNGGLSTTEMEQAMAFFQLYTISPLRMRVAAAFGRKVLRERESDRRWLLAFDTKRIRALQEDENKKAERVRANASAGLITVEEARPELGFEAKPANGETYLRSFSTIEVIAGQEPEPKPALPPVVPPAKREPRRYRDLKSLSDRDREKRATAIDRNRKAQQKLTSLLDRVLRKFFREQGKRITPQLAKHAGDIAVKLELDDIDWESEEAAIRKELEQFHRTAAELAFDDASALTGVSIDFDLANPNISKTLDLLGTRIVGIAEETRSNVADVLDAWAAEGGTLDDLASRLKGLFEETYRGRAMTVARTESMTAYNSASVIGYEESGVVDEVELHDSTTCEAAAGSDGLTCPERNGLVVKLSKAQTHIDGEHPNGSLGVSPVVTLGEE